MNLYPLWSKKDWSGGRNAVSYKLMRNLVMQIKEVEIVNKLGLHARASAKLTKLASQFKCEVWAARNNRRVNAKSIMGVMTLAASQGSRIQLETNRR
jgi:phosphocarrier protein HPr